MKIRLILFALVFLLSGVTCSARADAPLRVLAIMEREEDRSAEWQGICAGLLKAEAELDGIDLTIYGASGPYLTNGLYQAQLTLAMQSDALIVIGHSDEESLRGFAQLKEHGVKLILLDTDAPECERDVFIGTDNEAAGRQIARWMRAQTAQPIHAIVIAPRDTYQFQMRCAGFFAECAEQDGMQLVASRFDCPNPLTAQLEIGALFEAHPEINAIFCTDPMTALAAAQVCGQLHRTDLIACVDCSEEIAQAVKDGEIQAVLLQQCEYSGYMALKLLADLPEEPVVIQTECELMTKDNLETLWP